MRRIALTLATVAALATPTAASGSTRPVLRCWNRYDYGLGVVLVAPSRCVVSTEPYTLGPEVDDATFTSIRWSHWGRLTVTGTARLRVCGAGCTTTFRVSLRLFGYLRKGSSRICRLNTGAYSKLRATYRADGRTYAHTYNVTPIDAGC